VGGTGVAYRTQVMPIRVTNTSGWGYDSAIAKCITYAADRGARGANVSFGGVCGSSIVRSAAKYMRDRGGIVTASAGNTGSLQSLGASDTMTCVSATNSADARTSWSTYGDHVDVAAPGESIYTTVNGSSYGAVSGTSFSAPVTLGVYALMMAANPKLWPSTLDGILFSTARDLGSAGKDLYYGYGRVDAAAAVAKAANTVQTDSTGPSVSIRSPVSGAKVSGVIAVDVAAVDPAGVRKVELYVNGRLHATDTAGPYGFSWSTAGLPKGSVTLVAKAVDSAGNVGTSPQTSVNLY
jgi:thermitase